MRVLSSALSALALSGLSLAVPVRGAFAQCTAPLQTLLNEKRYDDARGQVQTLIKANPSDDVALHCMGSVFMAMEKPADAIDWFEKAVAANDKVALHHLWLGNAVGDQAEHASKLKQPFMARRIKSEFEKAVELDPTSIDGRHGLIEFYTQAPGVMGGSMDKAREQVREITKLNPMRGHIEAAMLLERDKDFVGAEREFVAAETSSPDSVTGYTSLANFYRRQQRYPEAIAAYDKLLAFKPDLINARLNIAGMLASSNQNLDRGEREVKTWLGDPPKDAPPSNASYAHYVLGLIYDHRAKRDSAKAQYQTALTLYPKNEDAKKALAALK